MFTLAYPLPLIQILIVVGSLYQGLSGRTHFPKCHHQTPRIFNSISNMSNLTYSTGPGTCTGNLTLCIDPNLCTLQTCDLSLASFDYLPSVPGNALIAAIFGVCIVTQLILGIGKKTFGYMVAMFLGLLAEIIGYVARILLNSSPFDNNNFIMYLTCLTIAPALISASVSHNCMIVVLFNH